MDKPRVFDPARRKRLSSAGRRRRLPAEKILAEIGLGPGDVFVDIGCGTGFFTIPAAGRVGRLGRVYGLDIAPEMIADLVVSASQKKLANVQAILALAGKPRLPRGATFYFLANVLHEVPDKRALLGAILRSGNRRSKLVIIDYYRKKTEHGPPLKDRIPLKKAVSLIRKAGFRTERAWRVNAEEYGLIAVPK
jgi:ubiquinone/menaquinone biosynthesis C-methylase UbiE